jgi:hypothetical protein
MITAAARLVMSMLGRVFLNLARGNLTVRGFENQESGAPSKVLGNG